MEIVHFEEKYFTQIAKFWKEIGYFAPFDLKWAYLKKYKDSPDLFLVAIEDSEVMGTIWASYDLQDSQLVYFAFKEERVDIGQALLDKILANLDKRGTLTVSVTTRNNHPYEQAASKLAKKHFKFRKIATADYLTRFLTPASKLH